MGKGGQDGKHGYQIRFQCIVHYLVSSVCYRAHHGWTGRKNVKLRLLVSWKAILKFDFVNALFLKRAIILIVEAEFTECLLHVLVIQSLL